MKRVGSLLVLAAVVLCCCPTCAQAAEPQGPGADAISTYCRATERGHQIKIVASNSSAKRYHCSSICLYRQNAIGFTGSWQSNYTVRLGSPNRSDKSRESGDPD